MTERREIVSRCFSGNEWIETAASFLATFIPDHLHCSIVKAQFIRSDHFWIARRHHSFLQKLHCCSSILLTLPRMLREANLPDQRRAIDIDFAIYLYKNLMQMPSHYGEWGEETVRFFLIYVANNGLQQFHQESIVL
ncbi:hypothetical protein A9Q83_15105 [Alphaproteobacteria bacterium 46_93_T64]|nr:hypothetical protein A9Q83_15105 [Alphaproteobacteria bacterium 46_93_T64]